MDAEKEELSSSSDRNFWIVCTITCFFSPSSNLLINLPCFFFVCLFVFFPKSYVLDRKCVFILKCWGVNIQWGTSTQKITESSVPEHQKEARQRTVILWSWAVKWRGKREKNRNYYFRSSSIFANNHNYSSAISNSKCDKLQQSTNTISQNSHSTNAAMEAPS